MAGPPSNGLARTLLHVPSDQRDRLQKVVGRGADELIVDLEDAVTAQRKSIARDVAADWMQHNATRAGRIWLRINADTPAEDVGTISTPLAGVLVPRAEIKSLGRVDELLTTREDRLGIKPGTIAAVPLIETARVRTARRPTGETRVPRPLTRHARLIPREGTRPIGPRAPNNQRVREKV